MTQKPVLRDDSSFQKLSFYVKGKYWPTAEASSHCAGAHSGWRFGFGAATGAPRVVAWQLPRPGLDARVYPGQRIPPRVLIGRCSTIALAPFA